MLASFPTKRGRAFRCHFRPLSCRDGPEEPGGAGNLKGSPGSGRARGGENGTEISPDTYVNLMDQYRPCFRAFEHDALARRPTAAELRVVRDAARRLGLRRLDPRSRC